jgi:hypothetical protein
MFRRTGSRKLTAFLVFLSTNNHKNHNHQLHEAIEIASSESNVSTPFKLFVAPESRVAAFRKKVRIIFLGSDKRQFRIGMTNPVEQITTNYRQRACLLATAAAKVGDKNNLPSRQVAQYLLVNHPGYIPASMYAAFHNMNPSIDATISETALSNIFVPCCRNCGAAIQPGLDGTTVRVVANKKPKKQKQKPVANEEKYSNLYRFCNNNNNTSTTMRNDDKNYWLVSCGSCGEHVQIPTGIVRKKAVQQKGQSTNGSKPKHGTTQKQETVPAMRDEKLLDGDFISLQERKKPTRPVQTLLQQGKKKKKKPNELMNFLSSLNA